MKTLLASISLGLAAIALFSPAPKATESDSANAVAVTAAALASPAHDEPASVATVVVTPTTDSADFVPAEPMQLIEWQPYAEAYKQVGETGLPFVVLLGMESCAPCRELKQAIEHERIGEVIYSYVDVEQEPDVARQFGYVPEASFSVPQVYVYHQEAGEFKREFYIGSTAKRVVGASIRAARKLNQRVKSVLKKVASVPAKIVQAQPFREVSVRRFMRSRLSR